MQTPNHENDRLKISNLTQPGLTDQYLGFTAGYLLILVFYQGFFCPRNRQQLPQLVQFQNELAVNYGKLTTISVDPLIASTSFFERGNMISLLPFRG